MKQNLNTWKAYEETSQDKDVYKKKVIIEVSPMEAIEESKDES